MVISIDFDGTICELGWPQVGPMKPEADIYIRKLFEDGHDILINTCRTGKYEGMAQDFLDKEKIPYHYINSNLPSLIAVYGQDSRKISADIYIDDKCLMGLPDTWEQIYSLVKYRAAQYEKL
jgi:hypothetical protein